MQTPSNPTGSPLDLAGADEELEDAVSPAPGESLQRILKFELKEEGNHVLAVTVTYTETVLGEGRASGGRVRTFRKLYQFVAQQLLSVRTKAGELSQRNGMSRYLLEAQLENTGEAAVSLEVRRLTHHSLVYQHVGRGAINFNDVRRTSCRHFALSCIAAVARYSPLILHVQLSRITDVPLTLLTSRHLSAHIQRMGTFSDG